MKFRQMLIFIFLFSALPHLDRFAAHADVDSDPKAIFDNSKEVYPVKAMKKTNKSCEVLKSGKIYCAIKKAGKLRELPNPGNSRN